MKEKERILEDTNEVIKELTDIEKLDYEIESLNNELNVLAELMNRLIKENSKVLMNNDEYENKYTELTTRYEQTKENLENLIGTRKYRNDQAIKMNLLKESIRKSESGFFYWNESILESIFESALINRDKTIAIKLK